jgi:regulator of protease activity HflC (stomatin/prohibitin superfamily)
MFNPKRILAWLGRILKLLGPVLAMLFVLGLVAELFNPAVRDCFSGSCEKLRLLWWQLDWRTWLFIMILRNMLPGIIVVGLLGWLASDFVRAVFGLSKRSDGFNFVKRRLFGSRSFKPYLIVKDGQLPSDREPLMRVGGPGSLVVHKDSAVVLEKAGKLTRVAKKGFVALDAFERAWDVIDLRPHRWVYDVSAMTKDGIPVTCQADVTFQIDNGGQPPTQDEPFPATDQAIFYAATRKLMREASRSEDEQKMDWVRRVIVGSAEGILRSILATYLLDQLLGPAESNQGHYRAVIVAKFRAELCKQLLEDLGVKVTKVELGEIKVENKIFQQRIEAWQSLWKRWARQRQAEGEAERLQYVEAAKAQAQADMIVSITQAFQSLAEAGAVIPSQLVLLRMFEVLKRSSFDPQTGILFLPSEVLKTWQLVQEMAMGGQALPEGKEKSE